MRKSVLLLLLAMAIAAANTAYYLLAPGPSEPEPPPPPPASKAAPPVVPPPLEMLGHGVRMPTPEELENEARYDDMQVTQANIWLNSPQPAKRLSGAQQLSAFTTPEAEQILADTLTLDFDPAVRQAAAQSLAAFKKTTDKTLAALLAALEDDSEEVQAAALNTLLGIEARMVNGSADMKKFFAALAKKTKSRRVKGPIRDALISFMKDQGSLPAGPAR